MASSPFDFMHPAQELSSKYALSSRNVVSSAYWKVPDNKAHLTAVACHDTDPLVALASGTKESNLFIYEVNGPQDDRQFPARSDGYHNYPSNFGDDENSIVDLYTTSAPKKRTTKGHLRSVSGTSFGSTSTASLTGSNNSPILTHHQTISLGGIHSLAWVSPKHRMGSYGNVLATGHNSGLAHLILLPDPYANNGPAEILSRFNHTRHVSRSHISSSRIRHLQLTGDAWKCCPQSTIVSMFSEHIFMWDPTRSDKPIVVQRTRHAKAHHISPKRNGIISLATERGISIMDLRYKRPSALAPPNENDGQVSLVKWSSVDENRVASVHDQTCIKVWDIRAGSPLVTLDGHYDDINSIEWSPENKEEFYSASSDGTVRMWDIQKCTDSKKNMRRVGTEAELKRSVSVGGGLSTDNGEDWLSSKSWRLYRQRLARENQLPSYNYFLDNQNPESPCTTIFSNNREFLALSSVQMPVHSGAGAASNPQLVSIDNSGFFGIHSKVAAPAQEEEYAPMDKTDSPYMAGKDTSARNSVDSLASMSSKSSSDLDSKLDKGSRPSSLEMSTDSLNHYSFTDKPLPPSPTKSSSSGCSPRRSKTQGATSRPAAKIYGETQPLNFTKHTTNDEYMANKLRRSSLHYRKSMPHIPNNVFVQDFDYAS